METYPKIQSIFKRDMDNKGAMIHGAWTTPELEYLSGNKWEFTEKVDGMNVRVEYDPFVHPADQVKFLGRSDAAVLPKPLLAALEQLFLFNGEHSSLEKVFASNSMVPRVTLYGEGYGPKIQGGGKYRDDHSFVLFDVKIGDWWLRREDVDDIARRLGIDSVPVIGYGTLQDAIDIVSGVTRERYHRDQRNEGLGPGDSIRLVPGARLKSQWGAFEAEGIVARPAVPMFDRKGNRIITKIKGVDFK